jgi:hypothetical protein
MARLSLYLDGSPRMGGILENGGTNFHSNVSPSYLEKRNFKIDFELIRAYK